ncbi:ASCH/PUA domain-containing protein [Listeria seeligeri]|uniref:ASCH/PUA domain-containing protein n=2 Tax=Listeria seeligeri TaxID=1640 RepID=UPI0022EBD614|nr:ASCH/PUA domain-containing protein [Listeria seeligeri]
MSKTHELKILSEYFWDIIEGRKTFEIRKNDRDFQVGDYLILKELKDEKHTGWKITVEVTYITKYEQKENYVVMGIKLLKGKVQEWE